MRIFQASSLYPAYLPHLEKLFQKSGAQSSQQKINAFLHDRFGATHILQPILDRSDHAFFALGDTLSIQKMWAEEQGMLAGTDLQSILLAQIEHHRTEVFYSMDPVRFGKQLLHRMPGCVKYKIAWRAAPSANDSFLSYDRIVNNFPHILEQYKNLGAKVGYLFPAFDPVMDEYAKPYAERSTGIVFVGGYSRHHKKRGQFLNAIAEAYPKDTHFHLDLSRFTRLAETPIGLIGPFSKYRRERAIRNVTQKPVFGRALYKTLGDAKITINAAIDMAAASRGNMRCWEAMGCGSLLFSDAGDYPAHMTEQTMVRYDDTADAMVKLAQLINERTDFQNVAKRGNSAVKEHYSKAKQWNAFVDLVA